MRVLVTGAGRAIGAATVTALSARGHEVIASARDVSLLQDLDAVARISLDVTDDESVQRAHQAAGELDAVINNAAINAHGPLEDFPLDRLAKTFETNATGALRVLQPVLPTWHERGSGVVINVSSVQGRVATPLEGAYSASKHALEAISEVLHYELGHFGIRVVLIEPGYVAPGMKPADDHDGPPAYDELRRQWAGTDAKVTGATGRSQPESVAAAIVDALEDPATPLRVPVGADAEMILQLRSASDDAAFEAAMRSALELTW